ncbi:MAG: MoxR family ATPase [Planctomycetota bacterium]
MNQASSPDRPASAEPAALPDDDVQLLARAADAAAELRARIGQVVIGQDDIVGALLAAVFAQGHTLLIGVPGLAKTLLVKTLAEALGWDFNRIQFTPDMMPADIIGMELLQEEADGRRRLSFVPGPIFAHMILADEINRTPPKTQAALLEAMQERQVTSMGQRHALEAPFVVVATQNPIEQEGTYPLPEAQLDRFMLSLHLDYPSADEEEQIVHATTTPPQSPQSAAALPSTQAGVSKANGHAADGPGAVAPGSVLEPPLMLAMQSLLRRLPASPHVVRYAVSLARATRPGPGATETARQYVEWGAGPRAGQQMVLAGKAFALMDGQPAVTADHVRRAAPYVLRHRVLPNFHAAGEGLTAHDIVARILEDTAEPTYA